jgi:hypothetical protein
VSGEREQNWYPIGKVGWFAQHIREGIEVTAGQLGLLQPALAQPGRLDDATVARIIRVHQDQAGDLMLFQNQARQMERRTWAHRGPARRRPGV